MHYTVTKQTYRGAVRWRVCNGDCVVGYFPTRKEAVLTARLLAGWRGSVSIVKGESR